MIKWEWIIAFATVRHLMWGWAMLAEPPQGKDYTGGVSWNVYVEHLGTTFWGVTMIAASMLVLLAIFVRSEAKSMALCLPQQAVLTVGAVGFVMNCFGWSEAQFEASRLWRVAPDAVGMFIFHTLALLEIHGAANFSGRIMARIKVMQVRWGLR